MSEIKFNRNFYSPEPVAGYADVRKVTNQDGSVSYVTDFKLPTWPDGSDAYANNYKTYLSFQNIRNKEDIFFKAFITSYNESFTPNFNPTEVFGRTDPIMQYKNTTRTITLAWKMPAASAGEAYENLGKIEKLITMLYPNYTDVQNSLTLAEAPLVRLKVMNLVQKVKNPESTKDLFTEEIYNKYKSEADPGNGLLGVITSCNINHNLEGPDGVFQKPGQTNTILPKLIDVNISFTPLHEKTLTGNQNVSLYGAALSGEDKKTENKLVESGRSLTELRAIKKTLEEKRRGQAAAQQRADKAAAKYERTLKKVERRGGLENTSERFQRKAAERQVENAIATGRSNDLNEEIESLDELI